MIGDLRQACDRVQRPRNRWTPLIVTTALALGVWALAAVNGHGWEMLWLPGVMAGAAWPLKEGVHR